jgi:hypothetical protein
MNFHNKKGPLNLIASELNGQGLKRKFTAWLTQSTGYPLVVQWVMRIMRDFHAQGVRRGWK